jgi:hypothetical protein
VHHGDLRGEAGDESDSSTAELPPPMTTACLPSKYFASQVAQYEMPRPLNSTSPLTPMARGDEPVATISRLA